MTHPFTQEGSISGTAMTDNTDPPEDLYATFTKHQRWWIVFMAAIAGWFSTLSSFIYFLAIPAISKDLHTSIEKINLTVISYLLVSAFAPSVVGEAAVIYGRRHVFIAALVVYLPPNTGLALQSTSTASFEFWITQAVGI